TRDGRRSAVRVQRRQHEMARQRRLDCNLRGFEITDFADHDRIGIMAQDAAQQGCKGQPDLGLYLDLSDPGELVFDRVLDRDDVAFDRIEMEKRGVERRGLAAAGRSGDEDNAVLYAQQPIQALAQRLFHAETREVEIDRRAIENAQHDALTMQRGYRGDAQID